MQHAIGLWQSCRLTWGMSWPGRLPLLMAANASPSCCCIQPGTVRSRLTGNLQRTRAACTQRRWHSFPFQVDENTPTNCATEKGVHKLLAATVQADAAMQGRGGDTEGGMSLGSGAPAADSLVPCGRAARAPGPHSTPSAPDTESCLPVVTVRSPLLLGWWQECHPLCPVAPCF
jgi:hypothetical protein